MASSSEADKLTFVAHPVEQADRIATIDILRGVALLGILMMNIPSFSMPDYASMAYRNDPTNLNFWVSKIVTVFFEGKMRALFSMVFGAGVLLFTAKKETPDGPLFGRSVTGLFYRRMLWLVLFGLAHAHILLWEGDILYDYGLCGMIAFLFRKASPRYLIIGVPVVAILGFVASTVFMQGIRDKRLAWRDAQNAIEYKQPLTATQKTALTDWREIEKKYIPNKADSAQHTQTMHGSYSDIATYVRPRSWEYQTSQAWLGIWDPLALMLLGMALFKWGFFTGQLPRRTYVRTALIGYGLGLPLVMWDVYWGYVNFPQQLSFLAYLETHPIIWMNLIYPVQRILLVLAHASALILLIQSGAAKGLLNRLKAVGQMAFTNYILDTTLCTLIFYGYGANLFGKLEYYQLFYVIIPIWTLQLIISPIWLRYFRFGPLEWLWRSLTYWKLQPFRR